MRWLAVIFLFVAPAFAQTVDQSTIEEFKLCLDQAELETNDFSDCTSLVTEFCISSLNDNEFRKSCFEDAAGQVDAFTKLELEAQIAQAEDLKRDLLSLGVEFAQKYGELECETIRAYSTAGQNDSVIDYGSIDASFAGCSFLTMAGSYYLILVHHHTSFDTNQLNLQCLETPE